MMDYCTLDESLMKNELSIIPYEIIPHEHESVLNKELARIVGNSVIGAIEARKAEILVEPPAEKPKSSRGSHLVFTMTALYVTIIAELTLKLLSRARGALRL